MDVQTLVEDAIADQRFQAFEGAKEPYLVRRLSEGVRLVRAIMATHVADDWFLTYKDITLNGAAAYNLDANTARIHHVEIAATRAVVERYGFHDRGKFHGLSYPTGEILRVWFVPRWPDLFYGTAANAGPSTTILMLPINDKNKRKYGAIHNEDDRYNGSRIQIISGAGAGQVFDVTDFEASSGKLTIERWDSGTPVAVDDTSVVSIYLDDIDELLLPFIKDYAHLIVTGQAIKAKVLDAQVQSVMATLDLHDPLSSESSMDDANISSIAYVQLGPRRIQFLGDRMKGVRWP